MCHGEYKSLLMDWWRWLKHKKGLEVATSSSLTPLAPWSCWALFLGEFVDDSVLDLMIFPILIFFQKKKWTKDVARNDHDIYIYMIYHDQLWLFHVISYNWRCPCSWPFFAGWFAAIPEGPGQLMVRGQDGQMWVSMNTKHGTKMLKTRSAKVCTWHKII